MAIDSETEVLALKMLDKFRCCFFESELKREAEAIFLKHNGRWFQDHASRKPFECLTLIG